MLREIFGLRGMQVTGDWRKLRNEELHDLYCWPDIRVIRSREMRWARHMARMVMQAKTERAIRNI